MIDFLMILCGPPLLLLFGYIGAVNYNDQGWRCNHAKAWSWLFGFLALWAACMGVILAAIVFLYLAGWFRGASSIAFDAPCEPMMKL